MHFISIIMLWAMLFTAPMAAEALIGMHEGDAPKAFVLSDLDGAPVDVGSRFGQKPLILVFWELAMSSSFLDYSLDELKFLNGFYEARHSLSDLEIYGIYTPEEGREVSPGELERVRSLLKANGIQIPILVDRGFRIFREYGVIALPTTVMIEKSGTIGFIYPSFPLAARPLFREKVNALAGIAGPEESQAPEKQGGRDPHAVSLYHYALRMYGKGLREQCLSPLQKSLALDPDSAPAHNLMGMVLRQSGKVEESLENFEKAMKLDRGNVPARFNYALVMFEKEKYGEAEPLFREVLSRDQTLAEAHYLLGLLYRKTGRTEEAAEELGRAILLFEKKSDDTVHEILAPSTFHRISTLYALAGLYREAGETAQALELLQKATEIALGVDTASGVAAAYRTRDMMIHE
ncbi:MAG: tetratricopeptide repeat protein [Nitrospiraceae bacterium]|nr:MAG: tetratricopeptide repeat protein [Nitrospiraceae bacterium]